MAIVVYVNGRITPKPDLVQNVLWMPVFDVRYAPNGTWADPWKGVARITDFTERVDSQTGAWVPPWMPGWRSPSASSFRRATRSCEG